MATKQFKMKNINLLFTASFIIGFAMSVFGQQQIINTDWGIAKGKLIRNSIIKDEKRVFDGPFSFNGKDNSPSTMIIKGNYKDNKFNGGFSMNWVCPSSDGFTFSASGKFYLDSMDGIWNFIIKGFDKGVKMNRKLTLTFNRGKLIQGEINNLITNSLTKFTCDKMGDIHGNFIKREKVNGFMEEEKTTYIHGVETISSRKDVASGKFLEKPNIINDTSIVKEKTFDFNLNGFVHGEGIYERINGEKLFGYLFTDDSFLGQFESNGYGSGFAPFIKPQNIILPKQYSIKLK